MKKEIKKIRGANSLGLLLPVVASNMIPFISKELNTIRKKRKIKGASATILDLTTIFFALGIMSVGVALAVGGLRNAGLIGGLRKMEIEIKEVLGMVLTHFENRIDGLKDEIKDLKEQRTELENKLEGMELKLEEEKKKKSSKTTPKKKKG